MNGILSRVRTWFNRNGVEHGVAIRAESEIAFKGGEVEREPRIPRIEPERVTEPNCVGIASCRHCGAELELVCPNGHGGADDVLADLTTPKNRAPAPTHQEESTTLNCSVVGCDAPRVPWKGRGRKPTRCADHITKHQEKKSA